MHFWHSSSIDERKHKADAAAPPAKLSPNQVDMHMHMRSHLWSLSFGEYMHGHVYSMLHQARQSRPSAYRFLHDAGCCCTISSASASACQMLYFYAASSLAARLHNAAPLCCNLCDKRKAFCLASMRRRNTKYVLVPALALDSDACTTNECERTQNTTTLLNNTTHLPDTSSSVRPNACCV